MFDELAINVPSAVTTAPAYQDGQSGVQIAGYKYDSYTPTSALLEVALRHERGRSQRSSTADALDRERLEVRLSS